ncbi:MAG: decaprenyl-phosphate phosphoribosyltransferase [Candidatus Eremiobacterota bacterium]
MFKNLAVAMRPKQWTKNFLIFAALIFAERLFHYHDILLVGIAFVLFCLLSSSIYIINDLVDIEQDREHPEKRKRPFASGKISKITGIIFSVLLALISLISAFIIKIDFFIIASLYFILNLIYSFKLKRLPILDVLSISLSFVLRAAAGGVIIRVFVSPWLIVCTFLLALFMAIGKRRGELILLEENHAKHRHVLSSYSIKLLDQMISVSTSSILIAYSLYTFTSGKSVALMCTIPFVIYGIFRYLYLVYQENRGDNPTSIFISDRPMQINMFCWLISVLIIFYWKHIYTVFDNR